MKHLTFGVGASPYLATQILQQVVSDHQPEQQKLVYLLLRQQKSGDDSPPGEKQLSSSLRVHPDRAQRDRERRSHHFRSLKDNTCPLEHLPGSAVLVSTRDGQFHTNQVNYHFGRHSSLRRTNLVRPGNTLPQDCSLMLMAVRNELEQSNTC